MVGNVGDDEGEVFRMFGDADINLGGEVPLPGLEIDEDVVEEDVLIKLA